MLRSGSCNTSEMARNMAHDTKEGFKANDMRIYRYLQNPEFQVDDKLWRNHINMVFDAMLERALIKKGMRIPIKIDFTSSTDNFLILCASVNFNARNVTLYCSMRLYPKKAKQMDQKKMEEAFLKALHHILSTKYRYIIIADRGFGNQRFARICGKLGFDYLLRINDNLGLKVNDQKTNLEDFAGSEFDIEAEVTNWKETHRFVGCTKEKEYWVMFTSLKDDRQKLAGLYSQRFGIEKHFYDQKSGGFNIEASKIRKYDRFKRLYFIVCMSQFFTVLVGEFLSVNNHPLKKKYPVHISLILVCSGWDVKLFEGFSKDA